MALTEAIKTYHDLLTDDMAADSQGQLDDQLRRRGCFWHTAVMHCVAPAFPDTDQFTYLRRAIRPLLRGFDKISQRAIADAEFRQQFGLYDWEEELVQVDPGFKNHTPLTRLDAFSSPRTTNSALPNTTPKCRPPRLTTTC